ncbi:MAG TPA: SGNH/GDSL hydrolase family protein [Candidatus Krumholzibacteria bacterium]|nr:SGNH/GDSL hydrolase family protein [Candidatus Krumholzibacteria bacterium]
MSSRPQPKSAGSSAGGVPPAIPAAAGKFRVSQLIRFAAVGVQLALITLVVRTFDIESGAFFRVMTIACGGFVLHHLAPARLRLPVFALVSLAGIYAVLGTANAIQVVGLGLLFIGLAHLPVRFALRVALILAAAGVLAAVRAGAIPAPLSGAIWPIFGAMFMFRMIVYLYDLANKAAPFSPSRALAYFFMLPNVCFPLFPVVDYKTFCRTYYDDEDVRVYQTGVEWMFRGLIQLLLYRWVYQNLMVGADTVASPLAAATFVLTAFLMYLKISGSFHMIVGMLHLFGFNLVPTNNRYFLSESFTDYWRRINIYWKDFLQKVFFNPVYFRLNKRMNATAALVAATLIAFFVTWALHSYQWFWIRGSFPVIWQDIVFWSIMGLLVLGNMLWENKYGRQRSLSRAKHPLASEAKLALRTVGTFVVVCTSWVIWSSETFGEFTLILGHLSRAGVRDVLVILAALAALGVLAVIVARAERGKAGSRLGKKKPAPFWGPAYQVAASCVVILFIAYAPLVMPVDPAISNVVDNLKTSRLNSRDMAMMDRGYYEDLTNVARFNEGLGNLYAQKPPNWERCWAMHSREGCPDFELMPNKEVWFKGAMMSTNQWAMRDRPYDEAKPEGTYRIAVTGASHDMGTGVGDDEVYDNVVEDRLNAEGGAVHYELLNFSVGGYGPLQRLVDMDLRMFDFDLDAMLYVGIDDLYWMVKDVADAAQHDLPVPYEYINNVMKEEGLAPGTAYAESVQKLKPRSEELLRWLYDEIVRRCNERGIVPMAGYIPHMMSIDAEPAKVAAVRRQMEIAREAGMVVIDMTDAYDGTDYRSLWIAPWDSHPNAEGHGLLADKLYDELKRAASL